MIKIKIIVDTVTQTFEWKPSDPLSPVLSYYSSIHDWIFLVNQSFCIKYVVDHSTFLFLPPTFVHNGIGFDSVIILKRHRPKV